MTSTVSPRCHARPMANIDATTPVRDLDEVSDANECDFLLALLVRIVNDDPSQVTGVTLTVRGAVISGTLASGAEYLEAMAEAVDEAVRHDTSDEPKPGSLATYYRDCAKRFYGDDVDGDDMTLTFVHLRDAQVYQAGWGHAIPTPGTWWRGRLTSVDGWMLGRLTLPDKPEA